MKSVDNIEKVEFDIKWEDKPSGLWQRFLTLIHLNFTTYQISKDELIIKSGFFNAKINTTELYLLKDPDLTISLYQRVLGIGTVSAIVDSKDSSEKAGKRVYIKNIKNAEKVRKLLRDAIEDDVMERKITYFDKI